MVSCRVGATPAPLRATVEVGLSSELLTMVTFPVAEPVTVGAKETGTVRVWPGDKVLGSVTEPSEKPVPLTERELMVAATVPEDDKVRVDADDAPLTTLPNAMLAALTVRFGVAAAAAGTISQILRLY